jgi:hypothetical protein
MPTIPEHEPSYTSVSKYCACIEFHLDEHRRRGFHSSQLIHYALDPNSDAEDDKNAPPEKLALAFSTADVVILGWRLGLLTDRLRENELALVRVQPKRYSEIDRNMPFVTSIKITPIK